SRPYATPRTCLSTRATSARCCPSWGCAVDKLVAHPESAINGNNGPRDVRGIVTRDPRDNPRNLLGARKATRRNRREVLLLLLLRQRIRHIRLNEPRPHHVRRDPPRAQLTSQRTRKTDQATLRRRVIHLARRAQKAHNARDQHHTPVASLEHALRRAP